MIMEFIGINVVCLIVNIFINKKRLIYVEIKIKFKFKF